MNTRDDDIALLINQKWYAKRQGAMSLCELRITDITEKTIAVCGLGMHDLEERYEKDRISFIELIPDQ